MIRCLDQQRTCSSTLQHINDWQTSLSRAREIQLTLSPEIDCLNSMRRLTTVARYIPSQRHTYSAGCQSLRRTRSNHEHCQWHELACLRHTEFTVKPEYCGSSILVSRCQLYTLPDYVSLLMSYWIGTSIRDTEFTVKPEYCDSSRLDIRCQLYTLPDYVSLLMSFWIGTSIWDTQSSQLSQSTVTVVD